MIVFPTWFFVVALAIAGALIVATLRLRSKPILAIVLATAAFFTLGFSSFGPFPEPLRDPPQRRQALLRLRITEDARAFGERQEAVAEVLGGSLRQPSLPRRVLLRIYGEKGPPLSGGEEIEAGGWLTPLHVQVNEEGEAGRERRFLRQGVAQVLKVDANHPLRHLGGEERLLPRLRRQLRQAILATEEGAPVLAALALGDNSSLDRQTAERFRRCGASHLLSVSGLHFSVVYGLFFFFFFSLLRCSAQLALRFDLRLAALLLALPAAWLYAQWVYFSIPTWRSFVMLLLLASVLWERRRSDPLNYLLAAALSLLALRPDFLFSPSFQLSTAAVAGIILAARRRPSPSPAGGAWQRLIRQGQGVLLVSLAAWLATWGIAAFHFGTLQLYAVPANLLLVPWYSLIVMPFLVGSLLLSPLSSWLCGLGLAMAGRAVVLSLRAMDWIASLPGAELAPPQMSGWALLFGAAFFLFLFRGGGRWRWIGAAATGAACLLSTVGAAWVQRQAQQPGLALHLLDVGQGDALVLQLPGGRAALIDGGGLYPGGGNEGEKTVLPFLRRRAISRLDWVMATHPDTDHSGGLPAVLANLPVRRLATSCDFSGAFSAVEKAAQGQGLTFERVAAGEEWSWAGVRLRFFHAPCEAKLSDNDRSLALRLEAAGRVLLFLGDLGRQGLSYFPADFWRGAELLLLPHHGSRRAATLPLLQQLRPRLALLSAAFANRYQFPNPEIVEALSAQGIPLWRSDRQGRISLQLPDEEKAVAVSSARGDQQTIFWPPKNRQ